MVHKPLIVPVPIYKSISNCFNDVVKGNVLAFLTHMNPESEMSHNTPIDVAFTESLNRFIL